jgi:hypothetical protein
MYVYLTCVSESNSRNEIYILDFTRFSVFNKSKSDKPQQREYHTRTQRTNIKEKIFFHE